MSFESPESVGQPQSNRAHVDSVGGMSADSSEEMLKEWRRRRLFPFLVFRFTPAQTTSDLDSRVLVVWFPKVHVDKTVPQIWQDSSLDVRAALGKSRAS